jgi:hypothetical protein
VAQLVFDLKTSSSLEQKIVRSLDPSTRRRRAKTVTANRDALTARLPLARIIFDLGQGLLGALFLLFGLALTLTLWLMPVGLPMVLFGCAFIAAARDKV